jgi:hypothetical protein
MLLLSGTVPCENGWLHDSPDGAAEQSSDSNRMNKRHAITAPLKSLLMLNMPISGRLDSSELLRCMRTGLQHNQATEQFAATSRQPAGPLYLIKSS